MVSVDIDAVARVVTVTDEGCNEDAAGDDDAGLTGELLLLLEMDSGGDADGPGLGAAIGVGVVVPGVEALW